MLNEIRNNSAHLAQTKWQDGSLHNIRMAEGRNGAFYPRTHRSVCGIQL